MASRTNRVEVEIVATDDATKTIEKIEQKIDGLESDEARIIVTANTDRLQSQLDAARDKLDGLTGDEATVQARLIGNLESSLEQAETLLRQLDGQTGTVRINAVDNATGDLDRVEDRVRRLDGSMARVRTTATGVAGTSVGGKTVGIAAIAAGLIAAVTAGEQLAGRVQQVADATGAPLDQASRLVTVWEQNGLEVSDLLDIIFQVNSALAENPDLAAQLGVSLADNQSLIDTFLESVHGVGTAYEDVATRQIAASQLFGEEGVRQVGAVTTAVGDLDAAMSDLPDAQVVDSGDVETWRETNAEVVELKGHLQEIQLVLSEAMLPIVNEIAAGIEAWLTGARDLGEWWAGVGGDFRRWLLGDPSGVTEEARRALQGNVPAVQNPQAPQSPQSAWARQNVTIVNPPGTPAATVTLGNDYIVRNGQR